jgi:ABC-type sugar transport system ATPase subunit
MTGEPLVRMTNISTNFLGVTAVEDVDFVVRRGEVMCLLGDNGAGKPTLVKILSGVHQPDRAPTGSTAASAASPRPARRRPAVSPRSTRAELMSGGEDVDLTEVGDERDDD